MLWLHEHGKYSNYDMWQCSNEAVKAIHTTEETSDENIERCKTTSWNPSQFCRRGELQKDTESAKVEV